MDPRVKSIKDGKPETYVAPTVSPTKLPPPKTEKPKSSRAK